MATVATLSDDVAVYGQSLLAANGQILLAAHTPVRKPTEQLYENRQNPHQCTISTGPFWTSSSD